MIKAIPQPDNITISSRGTETIIVRKWDAPWIQKIGLTFFCIAWNSFLFFWYSQAFSDDNAPWIMKVFPIGHVAVGVGLTYYLLTVYLNSSEFKITHSSFSIRHYPIYWPGGQEIQVSDIDCFYVTEGGMAQNNQVKYPIFYINRENKKKKLLGNIGDPQESLFLVKEFEKALGIGHKEIAGEYLG
jgi:hypothetical protein